MLQVGRNEPCPCGSGKKYKKCCANKTVSIDNLVQEELDLLQVELEEYFIDYYRITFNRFFLYEKGNYPLLAQNEDELIMEPVRDWYIFSQPTLEGKTVAEKFVEERMPTIQRQRTKDLFAKWLDYDITAGIIKDMEGDTMKLVDSLSNETLNVHAHGGNFNEMYEKGQFIFGILVGDRFAGVEGDMPAEHAAALENWLKEDFEKSGYNDAQTYLKENFLAVCEGFLNVVEDPDALEKVSEESKEQSVDLEEQDEVLFKLEAFLRENEADVEAINKAKGAWEEFSLKKNPSFQNPDIFVGALYYYLMQSDADVQTYTQKDLAAKLSVSPNSISKRFKEIKEAINE
ncbi:SEC-C metal-binding domain-containing protein [Falsibacillus albus]|uniref:SEC-C domain-containing protein n=1 Tax=Falsibacillus albus TaxID=2478915 RepID=A0A3L7K7R6_9BACI|nr:SEC-C metal-binding domain-containing protein [Falsibacillus albus]RLQ96772.1 hypothetical protein D9X91_06635 [Falsibacillus albus]